MKVLSEKETILGMIAEAQNELTKCRIFDRIHQKDMLTGKHVDRVQKMMVVNQQKMTAMNDVLKSLSEMLPSADDQISLAEDIRKYYTAE